MAYTIFTAAKETRSGNTAYATAAGKISTGCAVRKNYTGITRCSKLNFTRPMPGAIERRVCKTEESQTANTKTTTSS